MVTTGPCWLKKSPIYFHVINPKILYKPCEKHFVNFIAKYKIDPLFDPRFCCWLFLFLTWQRYVQLHHHCHLGSRLFHDGSHSFLCLLPVQTTKVQSNYTSSTSFTITSPSVIFSLLYLCSVPHLLFISYYSLSLSVPVCPSSRPSSYAAPIVGTFPLRRPSTRRGAGGAVHLLAAARFSSVTITVTPRSRVENGRHGRRRGIVGWWEPKIKWARYVGRQWQSTGGNVCMWRCVLKMKNNTRKLMYMIPNWNQCHIIVTLTTYLATAKIIL